MMDKYEAFVLGVVLGGALLFIIKIGIELWLDELYERKKR